MLKPGFEPQHYVKGLMQSIFCRRVCMLKEIMQRKYRAQSRFSNYQCLTICTFLVASNRETNPKFLKPKESQLALTNKNLALDSRGMLTSTTAQFSFQTITTIHLLVLRYLLVLSQTHRESQDSFSPTLISITHNPMEERNLLPDGQGDRTSWVVQQEQSPSPI